MLALAGLCCGTLTERFKSEFAENLLFCAAPSCGTQPQRERKRIEMPIGAVPVAVPAECCCCAACRNVLSLFLFFSFFFSLFTHIHNFSSVALLYASIYFFVFRVILHRFAGAFYMQINVKHDL